MDIDKITKAIEADAGQELPGLKESLQEMQESKAGRIHTPEQLVINYGYVQEGYTVKNRPCQHD